MTKKLHLGDRQPSGRSPLMRRRLPSTVISKWSLLIPASSTLITSPLSVAYTSVLGTQCARVEPSRPTDTERPTKCTDELTLHMAISATKVSQQSSLRKRRLISFSPVPPGDVPCAREKRSNFERPEYARRSSRSGCPCEN